MAKPAQNQPQTASETEVPFEQAIAELESIVKDMESERMPLDQLVERYERGNRLLKTCQQRIQEAEQRIEMIASGKSEPTLQPFEPKAAEQAVSDSSSAKEARPKSQKSSKSEGADSSDDEISLF